MAVISADSPGLQKGSLPAQIDGFGKIIQRNVPIINLGTAAVEKHVASVVRVPPVVAQASQSLHELEMPISNLESATEGFSQGFASEFTNAFMSVIDGSKSAKEAFADMAKSILSSATSMFASRFFSALFGGGGNGGGGIFSSLFGGFRAAGGPVSSGRAYVVGEKGPEMFVPGQSGAIIPNGGVTGPAINMSITINAPNSDKLALAALGAKVEKMAAGLQRTVRQTVQTEYNRNPRFVS
jgi:phage-related minor tail protein